MNQSEVRNNIDSKWPLPLERDIENIEELNGH